MFFSNFFNKIPSQPNLRRAPKTFFKALFYNTPLGDAIEKMSSNKSSPEGLKPQECERSAARSKPPISYIPAAMDTPKVINKVKVSDKMTLSVAVFNEGSPEQFLNHVQTSLEISPRGDWTKTIRKPVRQTSRLRKS